MSNAATLTVGLTAGTRYTSLSVTAMPVSVPADATVYVSLGDTTVEAFVTASSVSSGATIISVVSQLAGQNHSIGDAVEPLYMLTAVGRTLSPVETPRTKRL